jgi:hypothetical protein
MQPAVRTELVQRGLQGKFGSKFSDSFDFISNFGDLDALGQQQAGTATWLKAAKQQALADTKAEITKAAGRGAPMKEKDKDALFLDRLDALQNQYQGEATTDMRTASTNNPFKLAYGVIAKAPELANNPTAIFLNKYGPKGSEPVFDKVDEQYIVNRFAASVASGAMPVANAASALTEFYKFGVQRQAETTKWPLFGLKKPEKGYAVLLPDVSATTPVDLTNSMQVENMLTLKVARDSKAAALQFRVDAAQPVTQATRKSPAQLASEAAEFRMQQQQKQEAAALKNKQGLLQ